MINLKNISLFIATNLWACSRNTSGIIESNQSHSNTAKPTSTYTILWQNNSGNTESNNVVEDQLPTGLSLTEIVQNAPEQNYKIYAAPVIYSDEASNQFIFVLYAKSGKLQLIKFDYANGTLTQSSIFQPISFESGPSYKAHQIAIGNHNESMAVYVAHNDGLSKINAITGELMGTFQNNSTGYRVLIDENTIYFQDKINLTQLDATTFKQQQSATIDSPPSDRQLPLVKNSNTNTIYMETSNTIHCIDLSTFQQTQSETIQSGHISNLAAFHTSILYSSISSNTYGRNSDLYEFHTTNYHKFGDSDFTGFDRYNKERKSGPFQDLSPPRTSNGDSTYTSLSIMANDTVYISGYNTNRIEFTKNIAAEGTVKIQFPSEITSKLIPTKYHLKEILDFAPNTDHIQKISRFTVLDKKTTQLFGVFNINDQFHAISDLSENSFWKKSFELNSDPNEMLSNYNTEILIGLNKYELRNKTIGIQTMAVGKHIILLGADNGDLILIK